MKHFTYDTVSRILLTSILSILFVTSAAAQCDELWYGPVGDADIDIYVDGDGNSYAFENNTPGHHYFAKYSPSGEVLWSKDLDLSGGYFLNDVVGDDEYVYVITSYQEYVSSGVTITSQATDGLILKYDLDGNLVWQKILSATENSGFVRATSAVLDGIGNLYVGAWANTEMSIDEVLYSEEGTWTAFVKINPSGGIEWVEQSVGSARVNAMDLTENGNIIAALWVLQDFSIGGETVAGGGGGALKFNENGTVFYVYSDADYRGVGGSIFYDITSIGEDVYFTGWFDTEYNFDGVNYPANNGNDGIAGMLNESGELEWATVYSSEATSEGWGAIEADGDQVQILTPMVNATTVTIGTGTNLAAGADVRAMLINLNASSGSYASHVPISAFRGPATTFRGASIVGDLLYIPIFSFATFDPETDDLDRKGSSIMRLDLSVASGTNYVITLTTEGFVSTPNPVGTVITMTVAGDMSSGQWYKDGDPISGETGLSYDVTEDGRYHYEGTFANGCTSASNTATYSFFTPSIESDEEALRNFYDQFTNFGSEPWTTETGWLTEPDLSNWYGVTVENGRVTGLSLPSNDLYEFGILDLDQLTELKTFDLSGNVLTNVSLNTLTLLNNLETVNIANTDVFTIPDLSGLPSINTYDVQGNNDIALFDYEDNVTIPNFLYDMVTYVNNNGCTTAENGDQIFFSRDIGGENGVYSWTKDGVDLGIDGPDLEITSFSVADVGIYEVMITNSIVPGITVFWTYEVGEASDPIALPTGVDLQADWTGDYGGPLTASNLVSIESLGNGEYSISDVSGGFYALFGFGDQTYAIGPSCGGYKVTYRIAADGFPIEEDGAITYDEVGQTLTIPWRDDLNGVTGSTVIDVSGASVMLDQVVNFDPIDAEVENGATIALNATATSGLPVTYEIVIGEELAEISAANLTANAPGPVTVRASQAGNSTYNSAFAEQSFWIVRADPDFEFDEEQAVTYSGSPQDFVVGTQQANMDFFVRYDGSSEAPIDAGVYAVDITAFNNDYFGTSSGTLTINKATATITLEDLTQKADGEPKSPTVITDPEGLNYEITYDGASEEPVEDGEYAIVVEIVEDNYEGSAEDTFVVEPALGLDDASMISAYPNPSARELRFSSELELTNASIRITTIEGKVLLDGAIQPGQAVNISQLANGLYLVELYNSSKVFYKGKLIKN